MAAVQMKTRPGASTAFLFPDIRCGLPTVPVAEASDKRTFEVVRLNLKDKHRIVEFLRRFFYHDEPLNAAIGLKPGVPSPALEDFSMSTLEEGLSVGAVAADGSLVGVCINAALTRDEDEEGRREWEQVAHDDPEDVNAIKEPDDKFGQVKRLLMRVSANGKVFAHTDMDRLFDIFILSVDDSWRGKGIARKLLDNSRDIAQTEGFRVMRCICTSFVSALVVSRLGYRCVHRLDYKEVTDRKGQLIFPTPPPHEAAITYVLDL